MEKYRTVMFFFMGTWTKSSGTKRIRHIQSRHNVGIGYRTYQIQNALDTKRIGYTRYRLQNIYIGYEISVLARKDGQQ
jgi:hypothetical protein